MVDQFIVVDGHTHTYPAKMKTRDMLKSFAEYHKLEPVCMGDGTVEEIVENMKRDGIDYTILANFAPLKILHLNNLATIELSKYNKNLIALVSLNPQMQVNILEHLKQYIKFGAKGIKLHPSLQGFPPNSSKLQAVYEYCNETRFPIVFHCGLVSEIELNNYSDLDMIMPVIEKYQNIPIILTHMAEGKVNDVLSLSKTYRHVYFDTSIAISGFLCIKRVHDECWQNDELVIDVINKVGAEKIVFGSDYPYGSPIHDVKRFLKMNISEEQKRKILGGNAIRIYNIDTKKK